MPKVIIEINLPEGQAIPDSDDILRLTSPDWLSSWWHISDVEDSVEYEMTDEECREVLKRAHSEHDANVGISWDVIRYYADEVIDERENIEG